MVNAEVIDERRLHPRRLLDIEVDVIPSCNEDGADGQQRYLFSVYDISLCGMALRSNQLTPQVGERLCICLSPMKTQCDSDHIIEATVVRSTPQLIGVQFDSVGVQILKDIQHLLRDGRYF